MAATIVAYFQKPSHMMPYPSRVEKNLPSNLHASIQLKHGSRVLQMVDQPVVVET